MTTLPLTVLAWEGPQARAYLTRMRLFGVKVQQIVLMVSDKHPTTKKPIGRWIPKSLHLWYALRAQDITNNFWPRQIRRTHPQIVDAISESLNNLVPQARTIIDEMFGGFHYEDYAEVVERVVVSDLTDHRLIPILSNLSPTTVLFTGGGILRPNLLNIPGIRFIHIHPGLLPYTRGADGIFWSLLTRHKIGLSAFYMTPCIDEGELIAAREYNLDAPPRVPGARPQDKTLYRAIFSFFDPLLRAEFLVNEVLPKGQDLSALPTQKQDMTEGITYHFMHPVLLKKALSRLFVSG